MANADIRQLEMDGRVFYPQTDIHGLVNNGAYAIDAEPTQDSSNLVTSDSVYRIKSETLQENREMVNSIMEDYAPVEIHGDVTNAADEEDLTSVNIEGTDVLKLKDKVYNQLVYSGLGRKILRKNMVNGVNTLTQSIVNDANTIYVIQYDFVLGENITIPANCVLEFEGGSISASGNNDTITGNNTGIQASLVKIFNTDITLVGTWNVAEAYPEWFGANGDRVTDDRLSIQKTIDYFTTIRFGKKGYLIGSYYDSDNKIGLNIGQNVSDGKNLIGVVPNDLQDKSTTILAKNGVEFNILLQISSNNIHITDIRFEGNRTATVVDDYEEWDGTIITKTMFSNYQVKDIIRIKPDINYLSGLVFSGVKVSYCINYGFHLRCFGSTFNSCVAFYCGTTYSSAGFYFRGCLDPDKPNIDDKGNCTSLILERCYSCYCFGNGFIFEKITYSTLISCACDKSGFNQYGKTIASRIDLAGNYSYTYAFNRCFGISLVSCGLEQCPRSLYMYNSEAIKITGCSFDVYLSIFFPDNEDTHNLKLDFSNNVSIENSYLSHSLKDDGHLIRFNGSYGDIKNCYVNYLKSDRKEISKTNITVDETNGGNYILNYDLSNVLLKLGEKTVNDSYALPLVDNTSADLKGFMSFYYLRKELFESIGIYKDTFTYQTTFSAWQFGLLILRRYGSNACSLYMCDNTSVVPLSQNISEITVTVESGSIKITSSDNNQKYNYLFLSVPSM